VVKWLVAVQAQDYAGAKWALGARLKSAVDQDVERAFTTGAILRTHLMRPTWHFVTPDDIRWMLALTAPRVHAANGHMYRKLELDSAVFKRSNAVLARALRNGQQLTRDELRVLLRKAGIETDFDVRMGYLMMRAELDGIVCSGARRGKQFTYALLDERAPNARTLPREEALAELAHRYFVSRGPATVHDFAKWSGLTVSDATRGVESIKAQLAREMIDGKTWWFRQSARPSPKTSAAFLLSIYDEYVSSYKDRSAIVDAGVVAKLKRMGNALTAIIVVEGRIVGTWKREVGAGSVAIKTSILTPLTNAQKKAVRDAASRYADFLELPVVLS
jgi:hypothetical protein